MDIVNPKIEAYCTAFSSKSSQQCEAIFTYTEKHVDESQMLIGSLEAGFLAILVEMINAQRILEIGCYTGYSALAMAEHIPSTGELITLDYDAVNGKIAQEFWDKSEHGNKITLRIGEASEVIPTLTGTFDLVFIDADKENYINYLQLTLPLLSERGVIVADNTLWYGKVIEENSDDPDAVAIKEFNQYILSRKDLLSTIVSMRDGVTIIKKNKFL